MSDDFGAVGPRDGGIRGDDAGKVPWPNELENFIQGSKTQIRRHLHEDGPGRRTGFLICYLQGSQNLIEGGFVLKLAQVGRVWRTNVHDEEIGIRPEQPE